MTWTTDKPIQPGWYWWRYENTSPRSQWEVRYVSEYGIEDQVLLGEWAGPLEPPT